ncbi:hypothetical protein F5Y19DRAFT_257226 [Xylariaceae sp. FL1651]|nr:hypothetical protein F5Y19DRAFT_257226 [Xylariaceae sp. FL1651]
MEPNTSNEAAPFESDNHGKLLFYLSLIFKGFRAARVNPADDVSNLLEQALTNICHPMASLKLPSTELNETLPITFARPIICYYPLYRPWYEYLIPPYTPTLMNTSPSPDTATPRASINSGSQQTWTPPPTSGSATRPEWRPLAPLTMSDNYMGDRRAIMNYSANIPDEQSTSLWITNLPAECTYAQLLDAVKDCGKIYAAVINPPEAQLHMTSAAKLVFFDVQGKQRLVSRWERGLFTVGNHTPLVRPNRIRVAAQPDENGGPRSRVLVISGPREAMTEAVLCGYFQRLCAFDLQYVKFVGKEQEAHNDGDDDGERRATMEWAFSSYRCQAERVYNVIRNKKESLKVSVEERAAWALVDLRFGRDPCDRE